MEKDKKEKSRIKNYNYFKGYVRSAEAACKAAEIMSSVIHDLNNIQKVVEEIHVIENDADVIYHDLMNALNAAFITPIEMEDLQLLGKILDDVVDAVEDIVISLYIYNVRIVRPDAIEFAEIISKCCEAVKKTMIEFENHKKSKVINEHIILINDYEEQGDRLYQKAIRRLFTDGTDQLEVVKWREIYDIMEYCCDTCEDVADVVQGTILKNS
jgi:uncharacterized protein Yka (UPF0111/DUF47 family)